MNQKKRCDSDDQGIKKAISKGKGRPLKQTKQNSENQETQHWFQDIRAVQIVQLLGSRGQILFKCLSGQTPTKLKGQLESLKINYDSFKTKRQKFSEFLQNEQQKLLKRLLGEKYSQEIKYFFIGENQTQLQIEYDDDVLKLWPIIHPDFKDSFQTILQILKTNDIDKLEDLFNYKNHQHLVTWALITSWSKQGRELLGKLQSPSENNNDLLNSIESEEMRYLETRNCSIDELLVRFDYKSEIQSLIEQLKECLIDNIHI